MYSIVLLSFVIQLVKCGNNFEIPNVSDLPNSPGALGNIGNSGQNNGLGGILGIEPITNIGPGPIGNLGSNNGDSGQGGLGNTQNLIPQLPDLGQGGLGNLPNTGSQLPGLGQGGIGNSGNSGSQLPGLGQGGSGNSGNSGSQLPGLGQGGSGNSGNSGSQLPGLGQGGIGNSGSQLPGLGQGGSLNSGNSGSQLPGLGQGGIGNLGNIGSQLPGLGQGGSGNSGNSGSQLPGLGQNGNGNSGNTGSQPSGGAQNSLGNLVNLIPINLNQGNLPISSVILGDETNIERPCQSFDIYCIRRYFKKNSKCKEVLGPVPDPYYRAQSTLQLPIINATYTAFDVLYSGLNGRIVEFYINRDTDRLVIAVEFRNVTFYSKDVFFRVFRRAREPVTTFDYMYINYQSYITTTIIPKIRNLQLARSKTYTFTNTVPSFSIGPNAFNYPDPSVQKARADIIPRLPQLAQEAQLTEGPFSAATFIQNNICDFHLKVI